MQVKAISTAFQWGLLEAFPLVSNNMHRLPYGLLNTQHSMAVYLGQ